MPRRDGESLYSQSLTDYEEAYCINRVNNSMTQYESYCLAYKNLPCNEWSRERVDKRASQLEKKERIVKRIAELKELKELKELTNNQTATEAIEIIENNPKHFIVKQLYDFMLGCKSEGKRADQFKAIEAIAKIYNLFSDGNITNNQLNQIIIQAPDVNKAIESITGLVNARQISQK